MSEFTVIPAIDLKGGQCVRLKQGRADDATVYSGDPVAMARHWEAGGARWLHVVDLDGAFEGRPVHTDIIGHIADAISIPVEAGGGLRTDDDIVRLLDTGVQRVILGTRAWSDPGVVGRLVDRFEDAIAIGIDARDGRVQVRGWTETTDEYATELACRMDDAGVATIIYTDTARDGMLTGVNADAVRAMCETVSCGVIASGGVGSADDIRALRALNCPNLAGVIVGKALYEGRIDLHP